MKSNIIWYPINKKALPGVLIGMEPLIGNSLSFNQVISYESDISLGIKIEDSFNEVNRESHERVIVVDDNKTADLFSWLNTYTKESFPLSQFARVVTESDWEILGNESTIKNRINGPWANIVLGEILGQGEADVDLTYLPLSRAGACFSYSLARAAILYGPHSKVMPMVKDRLKTLQSDNRFLKRQIKVDDLFKLWDLLTSSLNFQNSPSEAVQLISDSFQNGLPRNYDLLSQRSDSLDLLINTKGLLSDSAETRVRAFDEVVDLCMHSKLRSESIQTTFIIASAAFLVGRGTSHISLLSAVSRSYPGCYTWFGLLAGLTGPRYWHPEWAKAIRGIEKQLWQNTSITEPTTADLCWVEYSWLSKTYQGSVVFQNLPKLLPRLLSVEIVPGASCQLRLEPETSVRDVIKTKSQILSTKTNLIPLLDKIDDLIKVSRMLHQSDTALSEEQVDELLLSIFPKPSKIAKRKKT